MTTMHWHKQLVEASAGPCHSCSRSGADLQCIVNSVLCQGREGVRELPAHLIVHCIAPASRSPNWECEFWVCLELT